MVLAIGSAIVAAALPAFAQSRTAGAQTPPQAASGPSASVGPVRTQPVRRGRVHRQPVINLEDQALTRRPGQVMPGDPPPEKFAPPVPEPASAATSMPPPGENLPPADLPSGQGAPSAIPLRRPIKPAPAPVEPDSGPRPLPRSAIAPPDAPARASGAHAEPLDAGVEPIPGSDTVAVPDTESPLTMHAMGTADAGPRPSRAASTADPLNLTVLAVSGPGVQWRAEGGAWGEPSMGASAGEPVEIRTGLHDDVTIDLAGSIVARVLPLSRIGIDRRYLAGPPGSEARTLPAIRVERGTVELRSSAAGMAECWVQTPDRAAGFRSAANVRIVYSAFHGTSVLPLEPSGNP